MRNGPAVFLSIVVEARPEVVREALTSFEVYLEWSRATGRIEGAATPGSPLHAWLARDTPFAREMDGHIVDVEQPSLLAWEGGVSDELFGRHGFEIANEPTGTRVTSSETFSGAFAPAVVEERRAVIQAEFAQFLRELRDRCERIAG
jgi:hypothetical protein